jgi:transcriptional regulator with XRE-family HTH domain
MAHRTTTLEKAVAGIVERYGGVRAASRETGVDKAFISRLMRGKKVSPSADTLARLGLKAVPLYEIIGKGAP